MNAGWHRAGSARALRRKHGPHQAVPASAHFRECGPRQAVPARSHPRGHEPRGSRCRSHGSPETPQIEPRAVGRPEPLRGRQPPPTGASAPETTYRCPPGERRMKYATAICHTVHSSAGRRTGNQPQGTAPRAPPAERTRAALRALVVQRRPRPQVTQRPSAPSSCCLSNARQAAASRHASAPAGEGFPEAPEGSRPRSGTVDPRTPRRYFCTPSARSPNSTASTPHYPLRRTFVR